MPAPVLPGGVFSDATTSWAFWASLVSRGLAAGSPTLPNTPSGLTLVAKPVLTGMSLLEGAGSAYSAERSNTVTYAMSQAQNATVAAKPNPFGY